MLADVTRLTWLAVRLEVALPVPDVVAAALCAWSASSMSELTRETVRRAPRVVAALRNEALSLLLALRWLLPAAALDSALAARVDEVVVVDSRPADELEVAEDAEEAGRDEAEREGTGVSMRKLKVLEPGNDMAA